MLSAYDTIMREAKIERRLECTYDNRNPEALISEYRATIDVLRMEVQRLRQAVKDSCRGMGGM